MLTSVSSGGIDEDSSTMAYHYYSNNYDLLRPAPTTTSVCTAGTELSAGGQSNPQCSAHYVQSLYRQHTNSGTFRNFSTYLGRAFMVSTSGYYVGCVSASRKDAGSVLQDGVVMLRFQKKEAKDPAACARGSSLSPYVNTSSSADNSITFMTGSPIAPVGGGQIANVAAFAFTVAADLMQATVNSASISLSFVTATFLPVGSRIVVSVPYMYFSAADSSKAITFTTAGAASLATARCVFVVGSAAAGSTVTCTTETAALAPGAQLMTFVAGAVTTGISQPPGIYNVMTTTSSGAIIDVAAAAGGFAPAIAGGVASAPLGGQIVGTSLSLATSDLVGNKVTESAVTIVFTAATAMPAGSTITISTPFNYFVSRAAGACAGTCMITCSTACVGVNVGNVAVVNVPAVGSIPGFGAVTVITIGAVTTASTITLVLGPSTLTTGTPQAASSAGITVSTTQDTASSAVYAAPLSVADHVLGYWSTSRITAKRRDLAAASVGNVALFAGGELSTGLISPGAWGFRCFLFCFAHDHVALLRLYSSKDCVLSRFTYCRRRHRCCGYFQLRSANMVSVATQRCARIFCRYICWEHGFIRGRLPFRKYVFCKSGYSGAVVHDVVLLCALHRELTGCINHFTAGFPFDVVDLFDSLTGTWSTASLSVARYYFAATSVGNVALFAGGLTSGKLLQHSKGWMDLLPGYFLFLQLPSHELCNRRLF